MVLHKIFRDSPAPPSLRRAVRGGFSLIEIIVVLGLLAVVAAFSIVVSFDSYRATTFHNERDLIISALHRARSQAIHNMCFGGGCTDGVPHGVHFELGAYTIFQGTTYNALDSLNEVIPGGSITSLSGPADVVFSVLSGDTTSGVITVGDINGRTSDITIESEGRIWWTN